MQSHRARSFARLNFHQEFAPMSLTRTLKQLVTRRQATRTERRPRRVELFRKLGNVGGIERLEDRQLLATVSASGQHPDD